MRVRVKHIGTPSFSEETQQMVYPPGITFSTYKEEVTLSYGQSFTDHVYDGELQRIRAEYRGMIEITNATDAEAFPQGLASDDVEV